MTDTPQLERCTDCEHVQYPARGFCEQCISPSTELGAVDDAGTLISWSILHASLEPALRPHLPLTVASVKLASGPVVFAYFKGDPTSVGQPVRIGCVIDPNGRFVLVAQAADESMSDENFF